MKSTITYIDTNGVTREGVSLEAIASTDFAGARPVRDPKGHRNKPNRPGLYWFSRINKMIKYESRLEMLNLIVIDFEQAVRDVVPQPLLIETTGNKKRMRHIPDFLLVHPDGGHSLIDVKREKDAAKSKNQEVFRATRSVARALGWDYTVMSEPAKAYMVNLLWLAGYRRPPQSLDRYAEQIFGALPGDGMAIGKLFKNHETNLLGRPALFHLLWTGMLDADLMNVLDDDTVVNLSTEPVQA